MWCCYLLLIAWVCYCWYYGTCVAWVGCFDFRNCLNLVVRIYVGLDFGFVLFDYLWLGHGLLLLRGSLLVGFTYVLFIYLWACLIRGFVWGLAFAYCRMGVDVVL